MLLILIAALGASEAVAGLALCLSVACEGPEWNESGQPFAFPHRVRLGNTVVMVVATNAFPTFGEQDRFDRSVDNVRIKLTDTVGNISPPIVPRSVFEVPASLSGNFVTLPNMQGASVTLAVFDTPAGGWSGFSGSGLVEVNLAVPNGQGGWVTDGVFTNKLYIEGPGGNPTSFGVYNPIENFGPRPMLRVRPRYELGLGEGFDPAWSSDIGSIELVITYDPLHVTSPEAFSSGDAARGFAIAGLPTAVGSLESSKVIVVDPLGFDFPFSGCFDTATNTNCFLGQGPFVDIAFTTQSANFNPGDVVFDEAHFTISDLRVYDVDGNPLPAGATGPLPEAEYLNRYVVSNLVE